jgi:hypothetical protein
MQDDPLARDGARPGIRVRAEDTTFRNAPGSGLLRAGNGSERQKEPGRTDE